MSEILLARPRWSRGSIETDSFITRGGAKWLPLLLRCCWHGVVLVGVVFDSIALRCECFGRIGEMKIFAAGTIGTKYDTMLVSAHFKVPSTPMAQ